MDSANRNEECASVSRRAFMGAAVVGVASTGGSRLVQGTTQRIEASPPEGRFDPWIEVSAESLRYNVGQVTRLTEGSPILAVVKNNAYGLGLTETAGALAALPEIAGFAVVKAEAALALRDAGIEKPILLMGMCPLDVGHELVARGIDLSIYTDGAADRLAALARKAQRPIRAHFYLDTGLGRMGMPYHRALPWIEELAARQDLVVAGTYMAFTEETDFDREQLQRFGALVSQAQALEIDLGRLHAASSNGVFHLPEARLDAVRPGIALFGAYPSRPEEERELGELRGAVRLRARIVRVVRLRQGDSAGYGRGYVAEKPTWLATIPVGHVDGVPRKAVDGQRVLIGDRTYPVVGAVSASHCLVELGESRVAEVGEVVTIVGPDHPDIHPNAIATKTGVSVYDVLMHLNPTLPRYVV